MASNRPFFSLFVIDCKYKSSAYFLLPRWLRSQRDDETTHFDFNPTGKRRKNIAIDEWQVYYTIIVSV